MRNWIALTLAVSTPWLSPAAADPGPQDRMLEIGLAAGAFRPASNHELYDSTTQRPAALGSLGVNTSLRLAFFPWAFLGGELESNFMPMQTGAGQGANLFAFRGHAILQLPGRFTPFALVGGGSIGIRSGQLGGDIDTALHWGLGAKFYLDDRWSIRLDGRQIISGAEGPNRGNTNHFEALVGISMVLWRGEALERAPFDDNPIRIVETPVISAPEPVPPVVAAEPIEVVAPTVMPEKEVEAVLERVHFAFGSYQLRRKDSEALNEAIELLAKYRTLRVEVIGHTDSTGPHRFNLKLSEQRANAVRDYLVAAGIEPHRIRTRGLGPDVPLAGNNSPMGRAVNRRIEFSVVDTDEKRIHIRMRPGLPAVSGAPSAMREIGARRDQLANVQP